MKTLHINRVIFDNSFIKENEDLLPDGFIWFSNILKNGVKQKGTGEWSDYWLVFNKKNGEFILNFHERLHLSYVNYSQIWVVFEHYFHLNPLEINTLCIPIIKHYLNYDVNTISINTKIDSSYFLQK